jgi:hypothetical protein
MHDALGDALVVEVGDLLAQDEVFQQRRAAQAGLQRVLVVGDRHALVGGEHLALRVDPHAVQRLDGRVHAGRAPRCRSSASRSPPTACCLRAGASTEQQLRDAVKAVGNSAEAVRAYLAKK